VRGQVLVVPSVYFLREPTSVSAVDVEFYGRGQSGLCVFGIFARRHNRMCMQVSFVGGSRRNSFKTRSLKNHANNAILAKTPFSIIPGKRTSTH
jgi:hypothetical protein